MARRPKEPQKAVLPISSKKQLLRKDGVAAFLSMGEDALDILRADSAERFPQPLQILNRTPLWSVEQIERYVDRKTREVELIPG